MPPPSDTAWLPPRHSRRSRLAWVCLLLVPLAIVCLFVFHFIVVSAGAAGGCGGA